MQTCHCNDINIVDSKKVHLIEDVRLWKEKHVYLLCIWNKWKNSSGDFQMLCCTAETHLTTPVFSVRCGKMISQTEKNIFLTLSHIWLLPRGPNFLLDLTAGGAGLWWQAIVHWKKSERNGTKNKVKEVFIDELVLLKPVFQQCLLW